MMSEATKEVSVRDVLRFTFGDYAARCKAIEDAGHVDTATAEYTSLEICRHHEEEPETVTVGGICVTPIAHERRIIDLVALAEEIGERAVTILFGEEALAAALTARQSCQVQTGESVRTDCK